MLILLFSFLFCVLPAWADQSIGDLPQIGAMMIHHFDCDLLLVVGPDSKSNEKSFQIRGSITGQQGDSTTVVLGEDSLEGSANSQMLQLKWTRGKTTVAEATTMIQVSTTKAYVLILGDPGDENSQASVSCSAFSFADLKGQNK